MSNFRGFLSKVVHRKRDKNEVLTAHEGNRRLLLYTVGKQLRKPWFAAGFIVITGCGSAVALNESDLSRPQPDGAIGGLLAGGHGILRSSRALRTIAVNSFDYKLTELKLNISGAKKKKSPDYAKLKSEQIHLRSAQRLLKLCEENRGIYIKAGQFVASLQHLPKEYTTTLSVLQDQAKYRPFKVIDRVFQEEFGKSSKEIFESIDEAPIAAASLAQVHRATLKDGREVAVKVQYPGLSKQVELDILTMTMLCKAVAWFFPDFQFEWIVPEFEQNLQQQLDFVREGHNAEHTARNFEHKPGVRVPSIFWDLTTRRVLTMEFMRGCKVDDADAIRAQGLDPKKVAALLVEVFAEMVFCHGFVHGDPHPGNILVHARDSSSDSSSNKDGSGGTVAPPSFDMVVLDHGLYKDLDEKLRRDYCQLWKAMVLMDGRKLRQIGDALGVGELTRFLPLLFTGRFWQGQVKGGRRGGGTMTAVEERELKKELRTLAMGDVTQIMSHLPRDIFIVLRTDRLVQGTVRKLGAPAEDRLLLNGKYAAMGLALRHRGYPDARGQGWLTVAWAYLSCVHLLLRLELMKLAVKGVAMVRSLQREMQQLQMRVWKLLREFLSTIMPRNLLIAHEQLR